MTITRMNYQYAAQSLSLFFRKNDTIDKNACSDTVVFDNTPAGRLFTALRDGSGDFSASGIKAKLSREEIKSSIWYKNSQPSAEPYESPPLLTFDDIMGGLATLCFAVPAVGVIASAGVSTIRDLEDNAKAQAAWFERFSEVKNPSDSPYQEVVDQIINYLDNADVNTSISNLFAEIASIQRSLNNLLVDPIHAGSAAEGKLHTASHYTKSFVLGKDQLGRIFKEDFVKDFDLLLNADKSWVDRPLDLSLAINPTYADATYSAFLSASITLVNALLVYAFIYVLPEKALTDPEWYENNPEFSIQQALANNGQKVIEGLDHDNTAWDALSMLYDHLDPIKGDWMERLHHANDVWEKIYNRLKMVTFDCDQPASRNGLWYLEESRSFSFELGVEPGYNNLGPDMEHFGAFYPLEFIFKVCKDNQIVCCDQAQDKFVNNRFRNFHTTINMQWKAGDNWQDVLLDIPGIGGPAAVEGVRAGDFNRDYGSFTYPLDKNHTGGKNYQDIFWAPGFTEKDYPHHGTLNYKTLSHAFKDATKPYFLNSGLGQDIVAWLGMVLANYCQQFRFHIDFTNKTNTLTMALATLKAYEAVHEVVAELLGESNG